MRRTMTEVRTFNVRVYCDCGAEYKWNGTALMTHPPKYPHTCPECGDRVTLKDSYPTQETVEVGEPQEA